MRVLAPNLPAMGMDQNNSVLQAALRVVSRAATHTRPNEEDEKLVKEHHSLATEMAADKIACAIVNEETANRRRRLAEKTNGSGGEKTSCAASM
jgi:hypothetical protein